MKQFNENNQKGKHEILKNNSLVCGLCVGILSLCLVCNTLVPAMNKNTNKNPDFLSLDKTLPAEEKETELSLMHNKESALLPQDPMEFLSKSMPSADNPERNNKRKTSPQGYKKQYQNRQM